MLSPEEVLQAKFSELDLNKVVDSAIWMSKLWLNIVDELRQKDLIKYVDTAPWISVKGPTYNIFLVSKNKTDRVTISLLGKRLRIEVNEPGYKLRHQLRYMASNKQINITGDVEYDSKLLLSTIENVVNLFLTEEHGNESWRKNMRAYLNNLKMLKDIDWENVPHTVISVYDYLMVLLKFYGLEDELKSLDMAIESMKITPPAKIKGNLDIALAIKINGVILNSQEIGCEIKVFVGYRDIYIQESKYTKDAKLIGTSGIDVYLDFKPVHDVKSIIEAVKDLLKRNLPKSVSEANIGPYTSTPKKKKKKETTTASIAPMPAKLPFGMIRRPLGWPIDTEDNDFEELSESSGSLSSIIDTMGDRDLVIQALSYKDTTLRKYLTDKEYIKAYLLCDGFGEIDLNFIKENGFDWSHVRDSSPEAIRRCAKYLRSVLKNK